ncbi:NineTeen Complex (NTC) component [Sorochytrium milnesiophthora]
MARNEEKAQSMLYRFREAEMAELGLSTSERRPTHTHKATNIPQAEKWRGQVIRDISRKVTRIQDAGLSEPQVRDLNDEINKLFKEKWMWEKRIHELGGPDYTKIAPSRQTADGKEIPGMRGYKYFGRARELPGVKELLEAQVEAVQDSRAQKRVDLHKLVDAEYFGYGAEADTELMAYAEMLEEELTRRHLDELGPEPDAADDNDPVGRMLVATASILRPPYIPSQQDTEAWLLERRKREMLQKYLT